MAKKCIFLLIMGKEEQHNLWLLEQYLHISIIDLFYSRVKFFCPLAWPDEKSSKALRAWTDPTRINNILDIFQILNLKGKKIFKTQVLITNSLIRLRK